mgnify:CR=1 FL=1
MRGTAAWDRWQERRGEHAGTRAGIWLGLRRAASGAAEFQSFALVRARETTRFIVMQVAAPPGPAE